MVERQALIVANWKMNGSLDTARSLLDAIRHGLDGTINAAVAICPPFPYLQELAHRIEGSPIILGAQDLSAHSKGLILGMLPDICCAIINAGLS